jgi:uncharacterized membrane protein
MKSTFADKASDKVAAIMGSWKFVIFLTIGMISWIIYNTYSIYSLDPAPFMGMNLFLSLLAGYGGTIILIAQNRQAAIDRKKADHDYKTNIKAELEIRQLHDKLDMFKEQEIKELISIIKALQN